MPTQMNLLADPRPDIYEDTALWDRLLPAVAQLEGPTRYYDCRSLLGALRGLRCEGAMLERDGARVRLVPGDMDAKDYADKRELWLVPHTNILRVALTELGERMAMMEANNGASDARERLEE